MTQISPVAPDTFGCATYAEYEAKLDAAGAVWYRFEDQLRSRGYVDEVGDYVTTSYYVEVQLHRYKIKKHTPKGVRLDDYSDKGRFVSRETRKRWACPTIEEARISFIARKKKQQQILEARARRAGEAIQAIDKSWREGKYGTLGPPT